MKKINALSWYRDGDVLQLNTKQFYTRVFNDEMHITPLWKKVLNKIKDP